MQITIQVPGLHPPSVRGSETNRRVAQSNNTESNNTFCFYKNQRNNQLKIESRFKPKHLSSTYRSSHLLKIGGKEVSDKSLQFSLKSIYHLDLDLNVCSRTQNEYEHLYSTLDEVIDSMAKENSCKF